MQGLHFLSLVRDLRSHMHCGQKTKHEIVCKQYGKKFNKDFKIDLQQQKNLFKKNHYKLVFKYLWWGFRVFTQMKIQ